MPTQHLWLTVNGKSILITFLFWLCSVTSSLAQLPNIASFTPTSGGQGVLVSITGSNFTGTTSVKFGGVPASYFFVNGPTNILAYTAAGASGNVTVTTPSGTASLPGFTFTGPIVSSFSPTTAAKDSMVTIKGKNFTGAVAVRFGGVMAPSFNIISDTVITAVVGNGASGAVLVNDPQWWGQLSGFTHSGPQINSYTPRGGPAGSTVTLTGLNFSNVTAVSFGGVPATSFTIVSPTTITAVTAPGSAGIITASSVLGTGTASGFNYPKINSFTPTIGTYGDIITINGRNFTSVTSVSFGNVTAQSFNILSDTVMTAVVGLGATGMVKAGNALGADSLSWFTYVTPPPSVTSFNPTSGIEGTVVTIQGRSFTGALNVFFGEVNGSSVPANNFQVLNDSMITATVGPGRTGRVFVSTPGGSANLPGFTFNGPFINTVNPAIGVLETDTVGIAGVNFTGVDSVYFGNRKATFVSVVNSTLIKAVPGNGASGTLKVFTSQGTAPRPNFLMNPRVFSFSPPAAAAGDTVTIMGRYFQNSGTVTVRFGNLAATSVTVLSDTSIRAVVAPGSTSGNITVQTSGGTASIGGFNFINPPRIDNFGPGVGGNGTVVGIAGRYLDGATSVKIGGVPVASFTVVADNQISAVVSNGGSGPITVTTPGGTVSFGFFTYFEKPVIMSFTPTENGPADVVVIRGQHLRGIGNSTSYVSVKFGGVAANLSVISDTVIHAVVGAGGASGYVNVETPGGKDSVPGFVFKPVPAIQSITPASAPAGSSVTITGSNFSSTPAENKVLFGAIPAAVTAASPDSLTVNIPAGVTFEPVSVSVNGLTGYSKKPFVVTYPGAGSFSFDSYGDRIHIKPGFQPKALVADIDGDGKLDLVTSNKSAGNIVIYRNTSTMDSIAFAAGIVIPACYRPALQSIKDMDGDGKPDLLLDCEQNNNPVENYKIISLKNTSSPGSVSFAAGSLNLLGTWPQMVAIDDMNLDGKPDLTCSPSGGIISMGSVVIYALQQKKVEGVTSFVSGYISVHNDEDYYNNRFTSGLTRADFNCDGLPDRLIGRSIPESLGGYYYFTILQNKTIGNTFLSDRRHYTSKSQNVRNPLAGDLNGDSLPDIINDTVAYVNTGNFTFSEQRNNCVGCAFIDDMDGDGKPDLVKFASDTFGIVRNKTTGPTITLAPKVNFYAGRNASHYAIGDLNGDGKPEIIISRFNDSAITILKNKVGEVVRLCPGSSTSIVSNISGGTYQWQVNSGSGYTNLADNATYTGTQTATLALNTLADSMTGYKYRCMTSNGNSYTFTLKFENVWTGALNTSWENPANWSCGLIPNQYTDVVINSGSIVLGANGICKTLTLMPGSSLTVLPGFTLTVVN